MTINSHDELIAAISAGQTWNQPFNKITGAAAYTAGRFYDLGPLGGSPVANAWTGTALNAQVPTDTTGFGMWHGGNVSTATKHLLNSSVVSSVATAVPGYFLLVDVCLYYPGIAMNSATRQTLVNSNTLTRYTNGKGLRSYLVITSTAGATAHNIDNGAGTGTEYVDQDGNTAVHPITISCTASAIVPHITHSGTAANNYGPFLPLASGNYGIRQYNYFKLSASSTAGTAALVICKPLAQIPITTAGVAAERDYLNQLPSLPKIEDGACLTWLYFAGNSTAPSTGFYGNIETVWN